jgi:O-antigen/teichoic acid export membrane protein
MPPSRPETSAPPHSGNVTATQPATSPARTVITPFVRVPTAEHFVRSVFSFLVGQGLSWVGSAALVVLLPRYLGDVNLGKFGFALAISSFVSLASDLGISFYLAKEIARAPHRASGLIGVSLLTRVPLTLLAVVAAVVFVSLQGHDTTTRALVYILCGLILTNSVRAVVQGALQGLHRMAALATFPAIANTVTALVAGVLLLRGAGPLQVAGAYVAGQALALALNLAVLLRHVRPRITASPPEWWSVIAGGLPFFIWQAALLIYGQVDTILLSLLTNDAVVGWYVAAYRFIGIPGFVPTILLTVAFPALAAGRGSPTFRILARRVLDAILVLTIPMSLGVILVADRLIDLLGYPTAFHNSVLPIALLAAGVPLVAADMLLGTMLNCLDRQKQWAMTGVAAAILNPLANLLAIPIAQAHFGNGAIGAAAVTTATEVFMMTVGLKLLPRGNFDRSTMFQITRCLGAAVLMAAVVLPLRQFPVAVPVVAGGFTYTVAALVLRVVSIAELKQVWQYLVSNRGDTARAAGRL